MEIPAELRMPARPLSAAAKLSRGIEDDCSWECGLLAVLAEGGGSVEDMLV